MEMFNKRKIGGPTLENFRLYLKGDHQRCPWNQQGADIFAALYVTLHDAKSTDEAEVKDAFLSHIQALCYRYKKKVGGDGYEPPNNTRQNRRRTVRVILIIYKQNLTVKPAGDSKG